MDEQTLEAAVEELSLLFFGGDAPDEALLAQRLLAADEAFGAHLLAQLTLHPRLLH